MFKTWLIRISALAVPAALLFPFVVTRLPFVRSLVPAIICAFALPGAVVAILDGAADKDGPPLLPWSALPLVAAIHAGWFDELSVGLKAVVLAIATLGAAALAGHAAYGLLRRGPPKTWQVATAAAACLLIVFVGRVIWLGVSYIAMDERRPGKPAEAFILSELQFAAEIAWQDLRADWYLGNRGSHTDGDQDGFFVLHLKWFNDPERLALEEREERHRRTAIWLDLGLAAAAAAVVVVVRRRMSAGSALTNT
jgi:hypothetical protein